MENKNSKVIARPVPLPPTSKHQYDYGDRHIINDVFHKIIYIQVLHDYMGNLKVAEAVRIKAGLWAEYVPRHLHQNMKQAIDAGFKIMPMFITGFNDGQGFIIYQMADIIENRSANSGLMDGHGFKAD